MMTYSDDMPLSIEWTVNNNTAIGIVRMKGECMHNFSIPIPPNEAIDMAQLQAMHNTYKAGLVGMAKGGRYALTEVRRLLTL